MLFPVASGQLWANTEETDPAAGPDPTSQTLVSSEIGQI